MTRLALSFLAATLVSGYLLSEQENADVRKSCGFVRDSFEWINHEHSRNYLSRAPVPYRIDVYNKDKSYHSIGVMISPRHVLAYAAVMKTCNHQTNVLDNLELRVYHMEKLSDGKDYTTEKVVHYTVLETQYKADKFEETFVILEREYSNYNSINYACLSASYQLPLPPKEEPLDERKSIKYEELCKAPRVCIKRFVEFKCVDRERMGRAAVFVRTKSLSMHETRRREERDYFVGFLSDDETILSVIPYAYAICKHSGLCFDDFNPKASPGNPYRGIPSMSEVIQDGSTRADHNVQRCTDSLTKLSEKQNDAYLTSCGKTKNDSVDLKTDFLYSIHARKGREASRFVCWAILVSPLHAIASRECSFDDFERGGMWLVHGDPEEVPCCKRSKRYLRGYFYLSEYGVAIVELERPFSKAVPLPCLAPVSHLANRFVYSPEFDEIVIEMVRNASVVEPDQRNYYSPSFRTWAGPAGTGTLITDKNFGVILTGIRLQGDGEFSFNGDKAAPESFHVLQLHVISDLICKLLGVCPDGYFTYDRARVPDKYSREGGFCLIS